MRKLARSALLGAVATSVIVAGVAQAHTSRAKISFEFVGTHASNDPITVPCEATDYLTKVDYNLDSTEMSPMGNYTGAVIKYIPEDWVSTNVKITFRLKNAVMSNNLSYCYLAYFETIGLDNNGDGSGDTPYDINGDGDTYDMLIVGRSIGDIQGAEYVTFRIMGERLRVPQKAVLYLFCSESDEAPLADNDRDLAPPATPSTYVDTYAPVIRLADLYDGNSTDTCTYPDGGDKACLYVSNVDSCCPDDYKGLLTPEGKDYCFIDTKCQFTLNMISSLSIIDMYPSLDNPDCTTSKAGDVIKCYNKAEYEPGRLFVNDEEGDILNSCSPTDNDAADGVIVINNDPDNNIDDDIVLGQAGWTGSFEVAIYDIDGNYACDDRNSHGLPKGPYKALDFPAGRMFIDNNGSDVTPGDTSDRIPLEPGRACKAQDIEVQSISSCSETSSRICLPQNDTWKDDVYMGVDNDDRLYWVRWGMEDILRIYDPDNNLAFTVSINEEEAAKCDTRGCCYDADKTPYFKKWEPNGDEAFVPYMLNTNLFRIVVSNNSCWDAEIYARVWDEKGRVVDNVYIGVVKANSVRVVYGNEIFGKARRELPELGRGTSPLYSTILTVGAPKRDVEFAAYDFRNGKSKMIPVYDLNAHAFTYRNVEFEQDPFEK